jgi:catechol 2,3-dioxygenase-like lactoylglutathione lyase family enzyme
MKLRQIALVARDLAAARADIGAVLGLSHAYADPGVAKYGLDNAVFALGDTFLEIVSPNTAGTTAGRLLEKRGGDGGYMVILQVDDLAGARARVAAAGVRIVDQIDRDGAAFTHLHPKDIGGAILSLDAMDPPDRWEWGGPDWRAHTPASATLRIAAATLRTASPGETAQRWAAVLGRPATRDGGAFRIVLDEGELVFARAECGDGLASFDLAVSDPDALRARAAARGLAAEDGALILAGTRVRLLPG